MKPQIIYIMVIASLLLACNKEEQDIAPEDEYKITIASGLVEGTNLHATILAKDSLETGFTNFKIMLEDDSKQPFHQAEVNLIPVMQMKSMSHQAPTEHASLEDFKGTFYRNVIFTMPGSEEEYWELHLHVINKINNTQGILKSKLKVRISENANVKVLSGSNGSKYVLALVAPNKPTVGTNNFEITVHRKIDGQNFPPVTDFQIDIEPEMPSMGHGSPNNVNPVHKADGHYQGKVNFTMNGLWKINLKLKHEDAEIMQTYFEVDF